MTLENIVIFVVCIDSIQVSPPTPLPHPTPSFERAIVRVSLELNLPNVNLNRLRGCQTSAARKVIRKRKIKQVSAFLKHLTGYQ